MDYQVNKNTIIGDILDKDGDVAPFFLEIRQYSCVKMSCSARRFFAAGHFASFQIHPRAENALKSETGATAG